MHVHTSVRAELNRVGPVTAGPLNSYENLRPFSVCASRGAEPPCNPKPEVDFCLPAAQASKFAGTSHSTPRTPPLPKTLPKLPEGFSTWVMQCLDFSYGARHPLGFFLRDSFKPCVRAETPGAPGELWPVPPPVRWRWSGSSSKRGARKRRRARFHSAVREQLRFTVATLNWLSLGCPVTCPPHAHCGSELSCSQHRVLDTLQRHIEHFLRPGSVSSADLGRVEEKFNALYLTCLELPTCSAEHGDVDRQLGELVSALKVGWGYAGSPSPNSAPAQDIATPASGRSQARCSSEGPGLRVSACNEASGLGFTNVPAPEKVPLPSLPLSKRAASATCKPLAAERIKWSLPPSFDPVPFLIDPLIREAYLNPDSLRLPESAWPKLPPAQVHASRDEVLKLAAKWDAHSALAIFPASSVHPGEQVGLFCIPKDAEWDRLILNPVVVNSRTASYSRFTRLLAPGQLLSLLHLPSPDHVLRMNADDLSEMYYTFIVTDARARRNSLNMRFRAAELEGFKAFALCPVADEYVIALRALAMGDSLAVEFAQASHWMLLSTRAQAMRPEEVLCYRHPFPRGNTIEMLAIDDHVSVQVLTRQQLASGTRLRDTAIFEASEQAYRDTGLVQHPRKRRRAETSGIYLGAELDGLAGIVSAPRVRVACLAWITAIVAFRGFCTPELLASLLGLWIHILLFRRPALALLSAVFRESRREPATRVFPLDPEARSELQALVWLAPVLQADLRVGYCPELFACDASPDGAGLVAASVPEPVVRELWRHAEAKGYYTKLEGVAAATLKELELDPLDPADQPALPCVEPVPSFPVPPSLQEGLLFDVVELFAGEGNWTQAHAEQGLSAHPGVDICGNRFRYMDMSDPAVFRELLSLALRRVVREWHAGPPCLTFGTLRRPRLRSKLQPSGFDLHDPLTALHNTLARRTAFLFSVVALYGVSTASSSPGARSCSTWLALFAWPCSAVSLPASRVVLSARLSANRWFGCTINPG